jgi:hypothetical protein
LIGENVNIQPLDALLLVACFGRRRSGLPDRLRVAGAGRPPCQRCACCSAAGQWRSTESADSGLDASILAEVLLAEGICGEVTSELEAGYCGLLMSAGL